MNSHHPLPDITTDTASALPYPLQWVGMEEIAIPVLVNMDATPCRVMAKANVYVNLISTQAKGIHMSRLHGLLNPLVDTPLSLDVLNALLADMVASQQGVSDAARLSLAIELALKKRALVSQAYGYQAYPVVIDVQQTREGMQCTLELTIPYSSTCPCSAALARQLYAEALEKAFPEQMLDKEALKRWLLSPAGTVATPHSQRSFTYLKLTLAPDCWLDLSSLIRQLEALIGTPVQTAVKREDEQAFAKLNAEQLMFCEDAARRLKQGLQAMPSVENYWFKVEHQESLHAHNAVVIDYKA